MQDSLYPIKLYIKHRPNLITIGISLALQLAIWIWLLWNIRSQEENIFLHYNVLFGVDYIGEWWRVYAVPVTGFVIFVANFMVGWVFFRKDKFVSELLNTASAICQIFLLIAAALLVFLNV